MIEFQNVSKIFKTKECEVKALENVSLTIEDGDIYGIIGFSGAGKSTLIRTINALEVPTSGKVLVDGEDINALKQSKLRQKRKKIGMIFQQFNLLETKTVYENIALPLVLNHVPKDQIKKKVQEVLEYVELTDKKDVYPSKLSGGQKQRVGIARALATDPSILLSDESTSALDPKTTKAILKLLKRINKELGITIVVVTHQMEVVKEICNKVAFLKNGKMIAAGKPEELFVAPNKDVQEFVGDSVEFLPKDGVNVRLFFNDETASDSAITHLAHELGINFGICQGKLENFRGTIMGSLVINVTEADKERVTAWLTDRGILWEVLENV